LNIVTNFEGSLLEIMGLLKSAIHRQPFNTFWVLVVICVIKLKLVDFGLAFRGEPLYSLAILPKPMLNSILF